MVIHYLTFTVGSKFIEMTRPWFSSWIITTTIVQLFYSSESRNSALMSSKFMCSLFQVTIIVQIWRKFKQRSRAVIAIMIESCAVYTLFAVALLIAYERASDLDWILLDVITPLVVRNNLPLSRWQRGPELFFSLQGVSFCLIIIQIHIHFQRDESTDFVGSWTPRNRSTGIVISSHQRSDYDAVVLGRDPKSPARSDLQSSRDGQSEVAWALGSDLFLRRGSIWDRVSSIIY